MCGTVPLGPLDLPAGRAGTVGEAQPATAVLIVRMAVKWALATAGSVQALAGHFY
jgi:hypothetical protein